MIAKGFLTAALAVFLGLNLSLPAAQALPTPEEGLATYPVGAGFPVYITGNIYEDIKNKVGGFLSTLTISGVVALMNAFQVFTQRIAYDAAQAILTGAEGETPVFYEDGFGPYLANVAKEAGDQFISSINEDVLSELGIDLCSPVDPFGLSLSLGGIRPPEFLEAKCTAAGIASAFEQTKANITQTDEKLWSTLVNAYDPNASELTASIGFHAAYQDAISAEVEASLLDREEGGGVKAVRDFLSGKITTPAQAVKDTFSETNLVKVYKETGQLNFSALMGNAFEVGFTQLGVLTAATFVNTLIAGALQRLFDGLTADPGLTIGSANLINPEALSNRNVARVRLVYSDLLTPNLFSSAKRDFVTELSACPTPRGTFNCAMDDALAAAFRSGSGAVPVGPAAHITNDGLPPGNPEFLHSDWELIPEWEVKDNTDPTCYQRAYCASNLSKLRYARIIPVGWELAANSPFNKKKNGKYITLGEVIRGFHVCNDEGEADSSHPWCGLVDPNWILSAPPSECRVQGYGDSVFGGTSLRLQECADSVSCLKRDDRGRCVGGYGYCVAEKPVWRFTADECEARFASCRTYTTRQNELVSYLRNTVDYGSCTAENVGCLWYSTEYDPTDPEGNTWTGTLTEGPRVYLDASVETCAASDAGCTRLSKIQPRQSSLNLVPNGSFEANQLEFDSSLAVWSVTGGTPAVNESSVDGNRSFAPNSNDLLVSPQIAIEPLRTYVVSAYVRNTATSTEGAVTLYVNLAKTDTKTSPSIPVDPGPFYRSAGCTFSSPGKPGFDDTFPAGEENVVWQRLECAFVSNTSTASGRIEIFGDDILVDAVQLEEGEVATPFVDGINASLEPVHLKVAPEELACTGDEVADHKLCANYARMCRQQDTGCQGYRDIDNPLAPEIPATLSAVDLCPAQCVGYAEYLKQPSTFDLGKSIDERLNDPNDDTVATFIPALAQSCSIESVGCEEFTNVETVAAGGEEKAHFNYVRACEKPGANTETYFTWEGSDQTGYQLRTWSLIHDTTVSPNPPKIIQKAGPEGFLKEPFQCNDTTWQAGDDPDCRQFFNADGEVFYRYFSQTVISSPSCTNFRKDGSNAADCEKTGGSFNTQTAECLYRILPEESNSCDAVNTGCRAYLGATGRNTTVALEESFHGTSTALFTSGELSNEAILVGDQSLKLTGAQPLDTLTVFASAPNQLYKASFWMKTTSPVQDQGLLFVDGTNVGSFPLSVDWRRHEIGPFSVSSTSATSTIAWVNLPDTTFLDEIRIERLNDVTFAVKDSWTIPPVCDQTPEGLPEPQAMLGCRAYEDRNQSRVTVRRFGHLCGESAIGCTGFVDTRNSENPYEDVFGLPGTDVNLKVTPEAQAWEQQYLGTATTTRPPDRFVYLIDEAGARCDADAESCRAFGKPVRVQAYDALELPPDKSFETVYFKDDITRYVTGDGEPNMLCRKDELFCEEFSSGRTIAYFRAPDEHACEWRDKVNLRQDIPNGIPNDGEYNGWFRTGSDVPCYPAFLSSGNTFLIQNSGDVSYTGWVGHCPIEQSECTEFRDPNDTSDPLHPSGKPYYFIKNQKVDVTSCNGQVDLLKGCILFQDLSDPRIRWSSDATYQDFSDRGDVAVAPTDCALDPNNPLCEARKCSNMALSGPCDGLIGPVKIFCLIQNDSQYKKAQALFESSESCQTDSDCSFTSFDVTASGTCESSVRQNDANVVLKVNLDRDCAEWLGCATAETVYDPIQQKYVDVCTETALCDVTKGANAGAFCGNYVNRNEHEILQPGAFFSRELYVSRTTGFGEKDYSGYAIPEQFQASDIQNREVAKELFFRTPTLANKFVNDFRLVAAVPENTGLVEFPPDENTPLEDSQNVLYPDLLLCRHKQTERTGYWNPADAPDRVCYFPIDALSQRSLDIVPNDPNNPDPRNMEVLADIFRSSLDPKNDLSLQRSFPPAECKANPEGDAPFDNTYVSEWDFTTEPFRPTEVASGYASVNFCENGEDCACSYRKVKYGGQITKYYEAIGQPPIAGVCNGGPSNGRACVPGESQTVDVATGAVTAENVTTENPSCPQGTCLDISDVVLVRGQFGQCLQRDYARSVAGDPARHPCLVWNPNPILAGVYDTYHYVPTAGYSPPVNAGEYYCLSYASPPFETNWSMQSDTWWSDSKQRASSKGTRTSDPVLGGKDDGDNQFFLLPGLLSKFNYDTGYIAGKCREDLSDTCGDGESDCTCHDGITNISAKDRDYTSMANAAKDIGVGNNPYDLIEEAGGVDDCVDGNDPIDDACDEIWRFQNLGIGIDGVKPYENGENSSQAWHCALAHTGDPDPENQDGPPGSGSGPSDGIGAWDRPPDSNSSLGRWIQTGRGVGRTQMEYFVPVKPTGVAEWLYAGADMTPQQLEDAAKTALLDRNFAQFQFFIAPDNTAAACMIPIHYVDGVTVTNWWEKDQVTAASNKVASEFSRNFDGKLDRSKESILVNANGKPIKETCSGLNDGNGDDPSENENADEDGRCYYKYWQTDYRMDGVPKFQWLDNFSGTSFYDRHQSYYAQERSCSKSGFSIRAVFENANSAQNSILEQDVTAGQLIGPWNFIGFWITACTAGTDYESFLYLGLKVKHADVCSSLAQVVSPYSRENAAFTDRAWSLGSFAVPRLGFTYQSDFPPFGSSLATKIPGIEPLFMTGGFVEDFSVLRPPSFLGAGQSYVTFDTSPLHKWAHLTNVFARVYRIYKYFDTGVDRDGFACVDGPNKYASCPSNNGQGSWQTEANKICGGVGTCDDGLVPIAVKNQVHRCNGLSGVNAGLECGSEYQLASLDPVCHNAAMKRVDTAYVPQLAACALRSGWALCNNGQYGQNCADPQAPKYSAKTAHEDHNAFGCAGNAVVPNLGCAKPEQQSLDCPLRIDSGDVPCIEDNFGPQDGHCGNGFEHARCTVGADDCVFTEAQFWGARDQVQLTTDANTPSIQDLAQADAFEDVIPNYPWNGSPSKWAWYYPTDGGARRSTFLPTGGGGTPAASKEDMDQIDRRKFFIGLFPWTFAGPTRWGGMARLDASGHLGARWPSPHLVNTQHASAVQAGLCEGAVGAVMDPNTFYTNQAIVDAEHKFNAHQKPNYALIVGQCDSGVNEGQFCYNRSEADNNWPSPNTCAPNIEGFDPYADYSGLCQDVASEQPNGSYLPIPACAFQDDDQGDPFSPDPSLDNNACTRPPGYVPWHEVCGEDPNNEKCLLGYDLVGNKQASLNQLESLTPTDVTSGLHRPSFLGLNDADPSAEQHIAFYAPRPPMVAAPDLSRTCAGPGSCPVSLVGRFTLEEQSEGALFFGGGQGQVTMRFYGWASHDQSPLKEVNVDWGDGTVTKVSGAKMKNKKPVCGGSRECGNVPGLTCNSDADCPPAGGACVDVGTCAQNPSIRCTGNLECELAGFKGDRCNIRTFFGNDEDACEENFFEFTHAYACNPGILPFCGSTKHCSRNPSITCTTVADCGVGDACVDGLGPSSIENVRGGCFDESVNACRFTPKVMLKDSWNWCTGECRSGVLVGNNPTDADSSRVRHIYGGCWDGTETVRNTNLGQEIMSDSAPLGSSQQNECTLNSSPDLNKNIRPWIVYPGAVNIGVFQ